MGDEISEIDKVKAQLKVLEDRERTEGSSKELDNRIAIKEQRLHSLEQQGNFSSHISIVLSQSSRCNPLPNLFRHLLFTHSGSATAKGKK